jgi:tRNA (mo5U34)-methyltransferase
MDSSKPYLPYLKNKELFLEARTRLRQKRLEITHWDKYRALKDILAECNLDNLQLETSDVVKLSTPDKNAEKIKEGLTACIESLIPWRTGPFSLFGTEIDSEWKSNLRWDRLKPFLPTLENAIVADIGSGNGYFMFRMLERNPKIIFGLDPQARCVLQFELINSFLKEKRLLLEPLGIENMDVFSSYFDFVLCMGVIYHRRDPHTCLTKVRESMKPGATFIIESLVVEGKEQMSFSPPDRYMKMRNIWFVPSTAGLCGWLEKTGFKEIKILLEYDVGPEEQRRTFYSPDESLIDFLDPHDISRTVEGYKAPKRALVSAKA